jgi:mannose-6-phosphate isomerase-like protein (cupin superfamily)
MNDFGPNPYVVNIEDLTLQNTTFRTAAWTGSNLQMTLMAIQPGDDIGLEVHEDHDQFLRIEAGTARVEMGPSAEQLETWDAEDDFAIFVPAGVWHNVINTGNEPLKLYSIYAPAEHPHGTVHVDKAEAEAAEHDH